MRVAYLVNRYPAASHSFIRREIHAVEASGTQVLRFSIRAVEESELPDPRDRAERAQTVVLLRIGVVRLLVEAAKVLAARPLRGFRA